LAALERCLAKQGIETNPGSGVAVANAVYSHPK